MIWSHTLIEKRDTLVAKKIKNSRRNYKEQKRLTFEGDLLIFAEESPLMATSSALINLIEPTRDVDAQKTENPL